MENNEKKAPDTGASDAAAQGATQTPTPASPPTAAASGGKETPQQEFDRLTARKKELWLQVKDRIPEIRYLTPEWQEIERNDKRMLDLYTTYNLKREED